MVRGTGQQINIAKLLRRTQQLARLIFVDLVKEDGTANTRSVSTRKKALQGPVSRMATVSLRCCSHSAPIPNGYKFSREPVGSETTAQPSPATAALRSLAL